MGARASTRCDLRRKSLVLKKAKFSSRKLAIKKGALLEPYMNFPKGQKLAEFVSTKVF